MLSSCWKHHIFSQDNRHRADLGTPSPIPQSCTHVAHSVRRPAESTGPQFDPPTTSPHTHAPWCITQGDEPRPSHGEKRACDQSEC